MSNDAAQTGPHVSALLAPLARAGFKSVRRTAICEPGAMRHERNPRRWRGYSDKLEGHTSNRIHNTKREIRNLNL